MPSLDSIKYVNMLKQDSPVFHLQPLLYFTYIRDLSDTLSPNPKLFAKENII